MKTILNVSGMTCGHCVKHVAEALRPLPGVEHVEVKLREGRAEIAHDGTTSSAGLIAAVHAAGYEAQEAG
ncbi:MAG TPA: cation transporter [Polyangiales bacterium]